MSTSSNKLAPLFKAVDWVQVGDQVDTGCYSMLSNIRDLASGVALALQIVERSEVQKDLGDAPLIDGADATRFIRMSIAAMNWVEGSIDEHFDEMYERAERRKHKGAAS